MLNYKHTSKIELRSNILDSHCISQTFIKIHCCFYYKNVTANVKFPPLTINRVHRFRYLLA